MPLKHRSLKMILYKCINIAKSACEPYMLNSFIVSILQSCLQCISKRWFVASATWRYRKNVKRQQKCT